MYLRQLFGETLYLYFDLLKSKPSMGNMTAWLSDCTDIPSSGWRYDEGQSHLPSDSSNSDIAGVGVSIYVPLIVVSRVPSDMQQLAIGFSAAAYITFILVVIYFLFGYVDPPFSNVVDQGCIRLVWRKSKKRPSRVWEPFLRKAILIYSDTQLVMGLAILGSLFPQLTALLPSYYWQIGVYLAWFSSHTHLTSITVLRQFFRDHPPIRAWRVIIMIAMVVLLAVALLPTGDSYWIVDEKGHFIGGVPAICHFRRLTDPTDFSVLQNQGFTMLISLLILFFGYLTRILKLSARATNTLQIWLRVKPGKLVKKGLDACYMRLLGQTPMKRWYVPYVMLESILILGRATYDAYESMLWEVRRFNHLMMISSL